MTKLEEVERQCLDARDRFASRYTWAALKAIDGDLHDRMREQMGITDQDAVTADTREAVESYEAELRGWRLIEQVMTDAGAEPDAFLLGADGRTGTTVVISERKSSVEAVADLWPGAIHMTPDEVAALVGGMSALQKVKQIFPGAEIKGVQEAAE